MRLALNERRVLGGGLEDGEEGVCVRYLGMSHIETGSELLPHCTYTAHLDLDVILTWLIHLL